MRMLSPRELFRAQGFPDDYVIDPIYEGAPLTKTAQIRCCGNSVCPQVAEAIVRANYVPGELPMRRSRQRLAVGQGVLL
jgi:DNA (cytosine-5)-methyltransferase 1